MICLDVSENSNNSKKKPKTKKTNQGKKSDGAKKSDEVTKPEKKTDVANLPARPSSRAPTVTVPARLARVPVTRVPTPSAPPVVGFDYPNFEKPKPPPTPAHAKKANLPAGPSSRARIVTVPAPLARVPVHTTVTRVRTPSLPPVVGFPYPNFEKPKPLPTPAPGKKLAPVKTAKKHVPAWIARDLTRKLPKVHIPPYRPSQPWDMVHRHEVRPSQASLDDNPFLITLTEDELDEQNRCPDCGEGPLQGFGHRPTRLLRDLDDDMDKPTPALPVSPWVDRREVEEIGPWHTVYNPLPPIPTQPVAPKPPPVKREKRRPQAPGEPKPKAYNLRRRLIGSKYAAMVPKDAVYYVPSLSPVPGNYVQPLLV